MKVKKLALELNYEPNQRAISFQQKKSFSIGVILPELSEAFFSAAISGIEDMAGKHNYSVLLGQSHDDEKREKQIAENMKKHPVDGLIVSIAKNTENYQHFDIFKRLNIPVLFFDRIPNLEDIHSVSCNMEAGTVQAVNFLLDNKHLVIGMINGPEKLFASQQRREGYAKAMIARNKQFDQELVVPSDLTKEGTQLAMAKLLALPNKPTAVIVFNDYVALDAIQYARQKNIRINEDITFVSFANLPLCSYMDFAPLASIEQFPYEQGQNAAATIFSLLNSSHQTTETIVYQTIRMETKLVLNNKVID